MTNDKPLDPLAEAFRITNSNRASLPHVPAARVHNLDGSPVMAWPIAWRTDAGLVITDPTGDLRITDGTLTGGRLVDECTAAEALDLLESLPDVSDEPTSGLHLVGA